MARPDYVGGPSAPADHVFEITPHDTNAVDPVPKAIRAGGTGTITLRALGSSVDVAHPVIAGERIDAHIQFVRATGTDVSVIGYA